MAHFTHITFTGVDEHTDLDRLWKIHEKYPFAEFGVLTSLNWEKNSDRYPNPTLFGELEKRQQKQRIPLSLHVCGAMARHTAIGKKEDLYSVVGLPYIFSFDRMQLNISSAHEINTSCFLFGREVIIQQKSVDKCPLFTAVAGSIPCSMLVDASGGTGKELTIKTEPWLKEFHVGFAGGIGEHNIKDVVTTLASDPNLDRFWVDMESSVRTDDKFDLDKVERVCKIVDDLIIYKSY